MAVTQLQSIKDLPYLVSNAMALQTCLPMAIGVIAFGKAFSVFFENRILALTGTISYVIYLVHTFTLDFVANDLIRILIFVFTTLSFAVLLNTFLRKIKVLKNG